MEKLLYTTYLASAIEHNPEAKTKKEEVWKKELKESLNLPLIGIYDPVEREANKTGKPAGEHVGYVTGLKQGGHWKKFHKEMEKIWWGQINPIGNKIEIMKILRNRFLVDGNRIEEFKYWGDIEAVVRSNFIFVYLEKNVKTVGTIKEMTYAELFGIPIYLILPDQTKVEVNSTLLDTVEKSGGKVFYNIREAINHVKEKYNIKTEDKK